MTIADTPTAHATPEPLPDDIPSVQPGGGLCYELELAWGRFRRWLLMRLRPAYVRRMAQLRQGDPVGAPHEILDPRDLKFCRNRCTAYWAEADDPFHWRGMIPFAVWGRAELLLMGGGLLVLTIFAAWIHWGVALVPGLLLAFVVSFFRDPPRRVPPEPGLMVSPADGTMAEITEIEHDPFIGGPAVRIGIFLSVFNVHINRAPCRSRVIALRYRRGEFLNALNPASAERNENMWIGLEEDAAPYRRIVVRQIAGAIARRICCALRPGEVVDRGHKFGMIKFGSRTELILPRTPGLVIDVRVGQKVKAGTTIIARY